MSTQNIRLSIFEILNPTEALEKQADEALERVKNGNYVKHEDLMEKVKNW